MNDDNGSAGGGQPGAGGAGGDGGQPWYASIQNEELRGYAQTKGFKDPAAVLESYRNFEKLQGVPQDRLLRLPDKADDPAWDGIYSRLGRPEKPEGYEFQFEGDAAFANRMAAAMHKAGISKAGAQALNAEWNAYVKEIIEADTRDKQQKDAADLQALNAEWGAKYKENEELARRAGREFGLSEDDFAAVAGSLGSSKALKLFQAIGAKMAEPASFDPAGAGGKGGFGLTAEQAKARIDTLKGDRDWVTKYLNGDATAKDEMSRLQQIAAGQA